MHQISFIAEILFHNWTVFLTLIILEHNCMHIDPIAYIQQNIDYQCNIKNVATLRTKIIKFPCLILFDFWNMIVWWENVIWVNSSLVISGVLNKFFLVEFCCWRSEISLFPYYSMHRKNANLYQNFIKKVFTSNMTGSDSWFNFRNICLRLFRLCLLTRKHCASIKECLRYRLFLTNNHLNFTGGNFISLNKYFISITAQQNSNYKRNETDKKNLWRREIIFTFDQKQSSTKLFRYVSDEVDRVRIHDTCLNNDHTFELVKDIESFAIDVRSTECKKIDRINR